MDNKIKDLINKAVTKIIENSSSKTKIKHLEKKHNVKIHFIPKRYRIFGGILQSMNIQFGNFIEVLMSLLIENDERYEIVSEYSGKKSNAFQLSLSNESLIDNYITRCQTERDFNISLEFNRLLNKIISDNDAKTSKFKHDIDLLFKDKNTDTFYYLECKYNDDHDTGKFVDINRKFIKTYAYLARELKVSDTNKLVPILFFFTNKKMKGNIYIPEKTNIYRGKSFFDKFLSVKYDDVDQYLLNLSESSETISAFKKLYDKIVNNID